MPLSKRILPHGKKALSKFITSSSAIGVSKLVAGANITLSPTVGTGSVTITAGAGGGGGTVDPSTLYEVPYFRSTTALSGTSAMTYNSSAEELVLTSTVVGNASLQLQNTQATSTVSGLEIYDESLQVFQIGHNNNTNENYLWGTGDIPLKFATSGTERMRIAADGNVGIGTTTPVAKLEVSGAIALTSGSVTAAPGYTSLWASGSGLYWGDQEVYTNTPGTSEITGGGVSTQLTYFDGTSSVTGSSNLLYDGNDIKLGTADTNQNIYLEIAASGAGYTAAGIKLLTYNGANRPGGVYSYNHALAAGWYTGPLYGTSYKWGIAYKSSLTDTDGSLESTADDANAVLVIQTDGNVGIGTASPSVALDVIGAIKNNSYIHQDADSSSTGVIVGAGGDANVSYDGSDMRINSRRIQTSPATGHLLINTGGGNVGIGTTTPSARLSINGDGTSAQGLMMSGDSGTNYLSWYVNASAPTRYFDLKHNSSYGGINILDSAGNKDGTYGADGTGPFIASPQGYTAVQFTNGAGGSAANTQTHIYGKLGIGTTSPNAPLHVRGGNVIFDMGSEAAVDLDMGGSTAATRWRLSPGTDFRIYDNWDYTNQRFTIKRTTGYVGIGTTSPDELLHVEGGDVDPSIKLENNRAGTNGSYIMEHRGSSLNLISTGSTNIPMRFTIQSTEMARIDNVGLGIGTTAPTSALTVSGDITLGSSDHLIYSGKVQIDANGGMLVVEDLTTNDAYLVLKQPTASKKIGLKFNSTGNSKGDITYHADGDPRLVIDCNHAITWEEGGTEKMRLTSDNLGIGTAAPNAPLDIYNSSTQQRWSYDGTYYTDITVANDGDTEVDAVLGSLSFKTSAGGKRIRLDSKGDIQADLGGSAGTYLFKVVDSSANWLFTVHDDGLVGLHGSDPAIEIKERAAAPNHTAAYGKLWVKNDDPANLYYTDDGGNDIALTDNGSAAGGGGGTVTGGGTDTYVTYWTSATNVTGTSNLVFDNSNGALGIGLDNPYSNSILSLKKAGASNAFDIGFYGETAGAFWVGHYGSSSPHLTFNDNNGAERVRIEQGGNVGIGTTSPDEKLDVRGDIQLKQTANTATTFIGDANRSSANAHITALRGYWNGTAVGTFMVMGGPDDTNKDDGQLTFQTASAGTLTERMRIDETGKVGIGTTSPVKWLEVIGDNTLWPIILASGSSDHGTGIQLYNGGSGGGTDLMKWALVAGGSSAGAGPDDSMRFYNETAGRYKMLLTSGGNLGIGTFNSTYPFTPAGMLHVRASGAASQIILESRSATENYSTGVSLSYGTARAIRFNKHGSSATYGGYSWEIGSADVGGTEIMRLRSDGNLGIGTIAPTSKLHVAGNVLIDDNTGLTVSGSKSNYGIINAYNMSDEPLMNLHSNRSGFGPTIRMIGMDTTGDIGGMAFQAPPKNTYWHTYARMGVGISSTTTDQEEGYIKFQTSQDGSLAEVMRIDGNARVGIGITSPAEPLHVVGDVAFSAVGSTYSGDRIVGAIGGLQFIANGGNAMKLTGTGLGIGTTAPAHKLDVRGDTSVSGSLIVTGSTLAVQKEIKTDVADTAVLSDSYSHYMVPCPTSDAPAPTTITITAPASPVVGDEYFIISQIGDTGGPFSGETGTVRIVANTGQTINGVATNINIDSRVSATPAYRTAHLICVDTNTWAMTISDVGPVA